MLADAILAILHHLVMFALISILVVAMMIARQEMSSANIRRLAILDQVYGLTALSALIIGFCRLYFGAKGWEFYIENWIFWAKMAAFASVAILSILPTMHIIQWRRASLSEARFRPAASGLRRVRRFMHMQAGVFLLIPIFAAFIVRGYGL